MRRVVELERDARRLRTENERLRQVESELEVMRKQVDVQTEYIAQLNDGFASTPGDVVMKMASVLAGKKEQEGDDEEEEEDLSPPPPVLPCADPLLWQQILNNSPMDDPAASCSPAKALLATQHCFNLDNMQLFDSTSSLPDMSSFCNGNDSFSNLVGLAGGSTVGSRPHHMAVPASSSNEEQAAYELIVANWMSHQQQLGDNNINAASIPAE